MKVQAEHGELEIKNHKGVVAYNSDRGKQWMPGAVQGTGIV